VKEAEEFLDNLALRFGADDRSIMLASGFMTRTRVCCPFLRFTLGVESRDEPLWLHLRGKEGAKEFIKTEIDV
jgi:hypothetical protein